MFSTNSVGHKTIAHTYPCLLRTSLTPTARAIVLTGTPWIPPGGGKLLQTLQGTEGGQRPSGDCSTGCGIFGQEVLRCRAPSAVCRENRGRGSVAWKQLRGGRSFGHSKSFKHVRHIAIQLPLYAGRPRCHSQSPLNFVHRSLVRRLIWLQLLVRLLSRLVPPARYVRSCHNSKYKQCSKFDSCSYQNISAVGLRHGSHRS